MRRCIGIIDLMEMNTLYGVMAFTEADLQEACRLMFHFCLLLPPPVTMLSRSLFSNTSIIYYR